MKETIKRYWIAFVIFFGVVGLMLLGTLGITQFEKKMFEDVEIKPRGEKLN